MSEIKTTTPFATIEEALEEIRAGRMVVVCDDENRENEGDLTLAAQFATPEAINFMAKEGRGLICLSLTPERCEELGLELMAAKNESSFETPFTVSVEAREGVTTGISAHDRARTIQVAIDPETHDIIQNLDPTERDAIQLPFIPTAYLGEVDGGSLSQATFDADLATLANAGALPVGDAAVFAPTSGDDAGRSTARGGAGQRAPDAPSIVRMRKI